MRVTWLYVGLVGCGRVSFDPRPDGGADASTAIECASDPRLLACYDFEGDLGDRTGHGNDAIGSQVTYVPGRFGRGVHMDDASRADLTSPSLDTTRWSFDAWIRPDEPPAGALELIFDHDQRWAIMLEDRAGGLRFGCSSAVAQGFHSAPIAPGVWTHVACIDDGTTISGYVDGVVETIGAGTGGGSTTVAAIGCNTPVEQEPSPYFGTLDRMRVWSVALARAELDLVE
jgi:hypothetical protein